MLKAIKYLPVTGRGTARRVVVGSVSASLCNDRIGWSKPYPSTTASSRGGPPPHDGEVLQ